MNRISLHTLNRSLLRASLAAALCLLLACQSEPGNSTDVTSEVQQSSPASPPAPPLSAAPAALDEYSPAPSPVPAANYFDQARLRADQKLEQQSEHCLQIEARLQDDCITSANTQHEAAIAAARVEYEAQLAEAEQEH